MAAAEACCPGWTVKAAKLGGVIPAVACPVRRVILIDPPTVGVAPDRVRDLLRTIANL